MEAIQRIGNVFARVVILLFFAIVPIAHPPLAERIGYAWAVLPAAFVFGFPFAAICAGIDFMLVRPRRTWRLNFLGPVYKTANDLCSFLFMILIAVGIGSLLNISTLHGAAITFAIYTIVSGVCGLIWQYAIQRFIDKRFKTVESK
jgi:hypothetical protein